MIIIELVVNGLSGKLVVNGLYQDKNRILERTIGVVSAEKATKMTGQNFEKQAYIYGGKVFSKLDKLVDGIAYGYLK